LSKGKLPFAIKWYWLHNAAGNVAKPVFCIADDSLSENAFEVHQVYGMGLTQDVTDFGWLVITKTRNCNDTFYDWFAENVVLDFIDSVRAKTNLPLGADGKPMHCFIACDGEYIQIKAFQKPVVLAALLLRNIHLGKGPASLSQGTQASDKSKMFKASKKRLKFIEATDYKDDQLRFNLKAIFDARQAAGNTMSNGKIEQFVDGIQRVIYAIKTTLTPEIVKQGYRDIGMFPVNFRATMANCTKNVGLEQLNVMENKLEEGAVLMGTHGEITEPEMTNMGIINVTAGKDKNERSMHRMRAVVMNDGHMVGKWLQYTASRNESNAAQAQRQAISANPNIAAERQALRDLRAAEILRRSNMTQQEKNAEAAEKRRNTIAAKKAAAAAAIAIQQPVQQQVQAAIPADDENQQLEGENGGDSDDDYLFGEDEMDLIRGIGGADDDT
jgi:hypothetical protein